MSVRALRPVGRRIAPHRQAIQRRLASTTESTVAKAKEAASSAKETASSAVSKASAAGSTAQQQASQALGAVQARASQALGSVSKMAGGIGDRLGSLLGSYRKPVVYNFQVGLELLKQVYVAERLAPPSPSSISSAYSTMFNRARDFNYWREILRSGAWAKVGIYALEAYGIFKIGEMIGRRSVVGYPVN